MPRKLAVALVVCLGLIRCSGTSPSAPSLGNEIGSPGATVEPTGLVTAAGIGGTWQMGGATGDFRFSPDPPQGAAPLTAHINMCHSTDPSPGFNLHYHVTWGDGSDDRGFCRFEHVYPTEGKFDAVACVWDEIPAHAPGSCLKITFTANSPATPTPSPTPPPTPYCHTLPAWCPAKQQFCEAIPISSTSSSHAKDACETCYGTACVNTSYNGNAWVAHGVTAFYYSPGAYVFYCTTYSYWWSNVPQPADVGDITSGIDCGAGFW